MFAFEGIDVLCCELALEMGSHPDNEYEKLVLPHLAKGEWKTQERHVMNSNVGDVPLGSNICDTGRQLNEQSPGRIKEGIGRLCIKLCILHHCEQTSSFHEGNNVFNKDTKDNPCVDGAHETREVVDPK